MGLEDDTYYNVLERRAERAQFDGLPAVDIDDDADGIRAEARAEAIEQQIQKDAIDVMACTNTSRYHTLNWLLWRMLSADHENIFEARDDFLKVLREEANEYLEAM